MTAKPQRRLDTNPHDEHVELENIGTDLGAHTQVWLVFSRR